MQEKHSGELIESAQGLRALASRLRQVERIGMDTEFVGERTYVPQLELIQLSWGQETAVVDCQACTDLTPLFEVLLDRGIEKVVHAGQQDIELLYGLAGAVPAPVFDTQVAAAMVGHGAQPGYAALVERVLHARLAKTQTLTDWSRRPLAAAQISYAHDDVLYLLPLRERLGEQLRELGREEWVREELQRLEAPESYARPAPERAYLRVRGRGGLRSRNLAVLRELASWREEEARRRNKPRGGVLSDDIMVEISRRVPEHADELRNFRGQFARVVERNADAIIAAVRRALSLPSDQWPQPAASPRSARIETGVIEVLQAALRVCAEQAHIAPNLLATSADLHLLVDAFGRRAEVDLPLLRGWRYELAGRSLEALLAGQATLRIDPRGRRVRVETRDER